MTELFEAISDLEFHPAGKLNSASRVIPTIPKNTNELSKSVSIYNPF